MVKQLRGWRKTRFFFGIYSLVQMTFNQLIRKNLYTLKVKFFWSLIEKNELILHKKNLKFPMKKTFLPIAFLSCSFGGFTQTYCESFDGQTLTIQDGAHAFNTFGNGNGGFLNDWNVTNGTPSIFLSGQFSGVNAYNGNQFVLAAVCDNDALSSEGLSLQHNFMQGNSYTVSMAIRNHGSETTPTPIDIEFVLLDTLLPFTYQFQTGCTQTPALPGGAMLMHTESSFATDSWQIISFTIPTLSSNYSTIWIRSSFSAEAPQTTTFFLMDSICIQTIIPSTCYTFDEQAIQSFETQHSFNLYGNGNTGFLEDWNVVSGTPSVFPDGLLNGVNAYEGSQFALAAICDAGNDFNESVSLEYNFQQGNSYQVSMALRNRGSVSTPTPIDVDFILTPNAISYSYNSNTGCSQIPVTPLGSDTIHSIPSFNQDTWQVITFSTGILTANYSNLWFRTKFSNGSPLVTTFFLFDSVCVTPNQLPVGLHFNRPTQQLGIFPNPASKTITIDTSINEGAFSIQSITGNTIQSGNLTFSGKTIEINNLDNGIYFFVLKTKSETFVRKFVVCKQ